MKSLKIKLAAIAILLFVGSMSVTAQIGRGGKCLNTKVCINQSGTCTTQLTDEQLAILDELRVEYQEEMAVLRAELLAATTLTDKIAIRSEMVDLRNAHLAEVQALLVEWGIK
ncbi:MAG: hypothetical protein WC384_04330 [Prolixibacteraceae bacterium]|jgi:hypothetical protein